MFQALIALAQTIGFLTLKALNNSISEHPSSGGSMPGTPLMHCGVCGMGVPRNAMKCPYCREFPR